MYENNQRRATKRNGHRICVSPIDLSCRQDKQQRWKERSPAGQIYLSLLRQELKKGCLRSDGGPAVLNEELMQPKKKMKRLLQAAPETRESPNAAARPVLEI